MEYYANWFDEGEQVLPPLDSWWYRCPACFSPNSKKPEEQVCSSCTRTMTQAWVSGVSARDILQAHTGYDEWKWTTCASRRSGD